MSTHFQRPYRSVMPYLGMAILAFGIMLIIFGGMIDSATRSSRQFPAVGPVLSAVTIPMGIGLVVFGGLVRKHAKRIGTLGDVEPTRDAKAVCSRCKSSQRHGAKFCPNCGESVP